jgi:hypothetical protein
MNRKQHMNQMKTINIMVNITCKNDKIMKNGDEIDFLVETIMNVIIECEFIKTVKIKSVSYWDRLKKVRPSDS